jgi:brefeldin A-inhibited guanine nucleotide-exchange protein
MVQTGQGGDKPREIFQPLRLACETKNEKLMIASLDCIQKLISHSFFAESGPPQQLFNSPPNSPGGRDSSGGPPDDKMPLVDLVVHTITSCHSETTPETVSLQIVKALLSLVLSSTILVHHSSLLKAVRTVYNVFLLSNDPVNQMVAQGGLQQMVQHIFGRCKVGRDTTDGPAEPSTTSSTAENGSSHTLASSTAHSDNEGVGSPPPGADEITPSAQSGNEQITPNGVHLDNGVDQASHTRQFSL